MPRRPHPVEHKAGRTELGGLLLPTVSLMPVAFSLPKPCVFGRRKAMVRGPFKSHGCPITKRGAFWKGRACRDRKSTRLNSSHLVISYAVFCLKKKKKNQHKLNIKAGTRVDVCDA